MAPITPFKSAISTLLKRDLLRLASHLDLDITGSGEVLCKHLRAYLHEHAQRLAPDPVFRHLYSSQDRIKLGLNQPQAQGAAPPVPSSTRPSEEEFPPWHGVRRLPSPVTHRQPSQAPSVGGHTHVPVNMDVEDLISNLGTQGMLRFLIGLPLPITLTYNSYIYAMVLLNLSQLRCHIPLAPHSYYMMPHLLSSLMPMELWTLHPHTRASLQAIDPIESPYLLLSHSSFSLMPFSGPLSLRLYHVLVPSTSLLITQK